MLWSRQMTAADDWNTSCRLPDQINCTERRGARLRLRLAADSGHARPTAAARSSPDRSPAWSTPLDPDRDGEILWQERVGKGGINGGVQWGSAADQSNVYVALSDIGRIPVPNSQATDAGSGSRRRDVRAASRQRSAGVAHAAAAVRRPRALQPGAVGRGQRDSRRGVLGIGRRTHPRLSPRPTAPIVWDFDTVGTYETVNGVPARGGSLNVAGPAISGGMLFVNSGYVQNGMPGNVLLAFSVDGK